jgi:hypothetical protein
LRLGATARPSPSKLVWIRVLPSVLGRDYLHGVGAIAKARS